MKVPRCGLRLGLAALAVVACAAGAIGAEPAEKPTGIVTDESGRSLEGVTVTMCGVEKFHDGRWHRNRRPHCLIPGPSISDKAGRFTVLFTEASFTLPLDEKETRFNFWFDKEGFAPTFISGISPQPQDVKVIMKRGIQVSGTVKRLTEGQLEPVKGMAVYLQCSSGDLAHQKRVFDDPYFFVMKAKQGCDLPHQQRVLTSSFGAYTVRLTPPPKDKKWFLVCLNEGVILDGKQRQQAKSTDRATGKVIVDHCVRALEVRRSYWAAVDGHSTSATWVVIQFET